MNHDEQVEAKIAEKFTSQPWLGVCPVEEAIRSAIAYRRSLCGEGRHQYDTAILAGWHPERAMSALDYATAQDATLQQRKQAPVQTLGR
jgi:hypothetical protein